jgi:hypothetical protein
LVDFDKLQEILNKASSQDLARIVWQSAQYNPVMRSVAMLHATFLSTKDEEALIAAVREASTIEDYVHYNDASSYSQILDEVNHLIRKTAESGQLALAQKLVNVAIECGDTSSEQIHDGDYWQMSVDDLRELAEELSG